MVSLAPGDNSPMPTFCAKDANVMKKIVIKKQSFFILTELKYSKKRQSAIQPKDLKMNESFE